MRKEAVLRLALLAFITGLPIPLAAQPAPDKMPPPSVVVAPVQVRDVAPVYSFIGRVQAISSVQLMARVTAFLDKIDFQQGGEVKQGQTLFELEKAPFEAAVQAAQAQLDKAKANLVQADAALQRSSQLNRQGFEAQAALDQARATRDSNAADVLAAAANLKTAQLNLSYCTIVSPIDGRIGASTYDPGNLVTPSSKPLATVNEMDPIRVVFSVSDRDLVTEEQRTGTGARKIAQQLTVGLQLANGAQYNQQGHITFIDNQVDPATGTITIWAEFANPDRLLLPGGYVTAQVRRAKPQEKPLVPVAATQTEQNGSYVLVVGPDNKVRQQPVSLGRQVAQDFIVDKGLSGGERVIVEGVQKVRPGQVVNPTEAPAPTAQGAPAAAPAAGTQGG